MKNQRDVKYAIYIGAVSPDWKPRSPWSIPLNLSDASCYSDEVTAAYGMEFIPMFNEMELKTDDGQRRWAVLSRHSKIRNKADAITKEWRKEFRDSIRYEIKYMFVDSPNKIKQLKAKAKAKSKSSKQGRKGGVAV